MVAPIRFGDDDVPRRQKLAPKMIFGSFALSRCISCLVAVIRYPDENHRRTEACPAICSSTAWAFDPQKEEATPLLASRLDFKQEERARLQMVLLQKNRSFLGSSRQLQDTAEAFKLQTLLSRSWLLFKSIHMAFLRKINQVLLFLLALTLCGILYKKVHKGAVLKSEADDDSESPEDMEEEIPVVICAAAGRMGAAMAAINSIYSNTDANIVFYVVGLRNTLSRIRKWIEHSKLREINFKIVEFNPIVLKGKIRPDSSRPELLQPLNFVRFYLPLLVHQHEKVIYLDDDVIVQGDIQELYDTTLALGHAAAFSDDCDLPSAQDINQLVGLQNTYMGYLDYRKKTIKGLGISPSTCSFNPGVIVANMTEWKHQRITKQLEKWMQKNVAENLYGSSLGGGVATSPMLIVFHGKHSTINPLWHIRHLGWNHEARYSEHFLQEAKLLHWNGRHKPWDFPSVHNDLWESWFVPDPAGIFKLNHNR